MLPSCQLCVKRINQRMHPEPMKIMVSFVPLLLCMVSYIQTYIHSDMRLCAILHWLGCIRNKNKKNNIAMSFSPHFIYIVGQWKFRCVKNQIKCKRHRSSCLNFFDVQDNIISFLMLKRKR